MVTGMDAPRGDTRASLRWTVYALLIATAAGTMVGRIFAVRSDSGATPFLCANDRSRWCTISALVDYGTYEIDEVLDREMWLGKKRVKREWQTIDKVQHKNRAGQWRHYSSKPPLLPTVLAGQYWLIKNTTGATLEERPFYVGRIMLIVTNVIPLAIAFFLLALIVERHGTSDFGRVFVVAAAAFGTLMTTFAVTLNNHVPAAVCVVIAVYALLRIWCDDDHQWWLFLLAGLFSAFAAANELPAASILAFLGVMLLWKAPVRTLAIFVPAVAIVVAAFLWTSYVAHNSLKPPYAHWGDGARCAQLGESVAGRISRDAVPQSLRESIEGEGIELSQNVRVEPRLPKAENGEAWRWVLIDFDNSEKYSVVQYDREEKDENGHIKVVSKVKVYEWDNWYDFPGSYWVAGEVREIGGGRLAWVRIELPDPDRGEPSHLVYFFHMMIGHHGVFSLTPIWIFSLLGLIALAFNRTRDLHAFAIVVAVISVVVIAFYVARPELQRNYGGVSCGLRWLMWLSPLWLVTMIPAVDWIGGGERDRKFWWIVALVLLVLSVLSASYASHDPWTNPWLYQYWDYLQWPLSSHDMLPPGT